MESNQDIPRAQLSAATQEAVRLYVNETMKVQQCELLKAAANTAIKIVETKINDSSSQLKDVIDDEVAGCSSPRRTDTHAQRPVSVLHTGLARVGRTRHGAGV